MRNIKKIGRVILSFLLMFVVVALIGVIFMKQVLLERKRPQSAVGRQPLLHPGGGKPVC